MSKPKYTFIKDKSWYGEIGVRRLMPHIINQYRHLDDDYDDENPDGSMYGRRNFHETFYISGSPDLQGSEEVEGMPPCQKPSCRFDYYREYH